MAVQIDPPSEWKALLNEIQDVIDHRFNGEDDATSSDTIQVPHQRTGRVVAIIKEVNPRKAVGKIEFQENPQFAKFHPRDRRMPRILIPCEACPSEVSGQELYLATIESWPEGSQMPYGQLHGPVGYEGSIEAETLSIMLENEIETIDFPPSMNDLKMIDSKLIEEEARKRLDLRRECTFTIDPSTAKDLDDALSIKQIGSESIGDELYQVGVHIADVSFFVREGSEVDEWARRRATTFYLVNKVIPMLPPSLSQFTCSLNPGHDKLTVSIFWNVRSDGVVVSEPTISRSVISSCMKLTYDQAQDMIDDTWEGQKLPIIFGQWTHAHVANNVRKLSQICERIRLKRRENGSLDIRKTSLSFDLNLLTQEPEAMRTQSSCNSKRLVEELMLMANMSVGREVSRDHPFIALLRKHPSPEKKMIEGVLKLIQSIVPSVSLEDISSKSLQRMIHEIESVDTNLSAAVSHLLLHRKFRSMKNASYFCAGSTKVSKYQSTKEDYLHFALNVDRYTHFTSPIRRYADIIVHRLLTSTLEHSLTSLTMEEVTHIADHCTQRNITSRLVSEQSQKLFFSLFIQHNPTLLNTIVVNILDRSFDALLPFLGITCRVYLEQQPVTFDFQRLRGRKTLFITWTQTQKIQVITTGISVRILVRTNRLDLYKFEGSLQQPET